MDQKIVTSWFEETVSVPFATLPVEALFVVIGKTNSKFAIAEKFQRFDAKARTDTSASGDFNMANQFGNGIRIFDFQQRLDASLIVLFNCRRMNQQHP